MIKTELYFGRTIQLMDNEKAHVSDEAWEIFKRNFVDDKFNAYTELDGVGAWCGSQEKTKILIFIWEDNSAKKVYNEYLDQMRVDYCREFDQESVMRVDHKVEVSFW